MPFESRRLRVQLQCYSDSQVGLHLIPKTTVTLLTKQPACYSPTIEPCLHQTPPWCYQAGSCIYHSCGLPSPVVICPPGSDPCGPGSPVVETPGTPRVLPGDQIQVELDPTDPEVVLLRPEHLPRLRGELQAELGRIEEIAQRRDEIEAQLAEVDSAEEKFREQAEQ
jgi:hypothetical protein